MSVKSIAATDTLEAGFRAKYNETILEIITAVSLLSSGILRFTKGSAGTFDVNFLDLFYTQDQIDTLLASAGIVVPNASEELRGIIRIATLAEMNLGEDDLKAITAYKAKYSSLFPFKGKWVAPEEGMGYLQNTFVVRDGILYQSLEAGNMGDPNDGGDWLAISGGSGATKVTINKTGADVSDYSLDLSGETIPSYPTVVLYINGKTANAPYTYDNSSKLIEGLPGTSSGDTIKIIFS